MKGQGVERFGWSVEALAKYPREGPFFATGPQQLAPRGKIEAREGGAARLCLSEAAAGAVLCCWIAFPAVFLSKAAGAASSWRLERCILHHGFHTLCGLQLARSRALFEHMGRVLREVAAAPELSSAALLL